MTDRGFNPTGRHCRLLRDCNDYILGEGVMLLGKAGDIGEIVGRTPGKVVVRLGNHNIALPVYNVQMLSPIEELSLASEEIDEWWSVTKSNPKED